MRELGSRAKGLATRVWGGEHRWLVILLAAYALARVVVLAGGAVFTSYDTFSYVHRGDPFYDRGPVVSFTGHAPRLWGVPLFYALFPSDAWRAAGQWALGTIAWATLAWVVWSLLRDTAARVVAVAGILLVALLDFVSNLDFAILSESLTVSLGVLVLAMLLRWLATGGRAALVIMAVAGFWWTFTRPDTRVLVGFVLLVLAAVAWRAPHRRKAAVAAGAVLLVGVGWCSVIAPVTQEEFKHWGAVDADQHEELWLYRLRKDILPRPDAKAVFVERFGMPACPGAERSAQRAEWDIVEFANEYRQCPDLVAWGEANRDDIFTRFALQAPGPYLAMTYDLTSWSLSGGTYGPVRSVLPGFVHRVAYPGPPWTVPFTLALIVVAVVAAVVGGAFRQRRLIVWTSVITMAACLVSVVATVVTAGGQVWRFGIQESLGIRIAAILMVAAALDSLRRRRRPPADATPSAAPNGDQAPASA